MADMSTMYHDFMDDIVSFHMELDSLSSPQVGTKADKPQSRAGLEVRREEVRGKVTLAVKLPAPTSL